VTLTRKATISQAMNSYFCAIEKKMHVVRAQLQKICSHYLIANEQCVRHIKVLTTAIHLHSLYYFTPLVAGRWAGIAQSVQWLVMGWMVQGMNPSGGEIFCTCPDRPWGPPSLLYNGYLVFPGGKATGA